MSFTLGLPLSSWNIFRLFWQEHYVRDAVSFWACTLTPVWCMGVRCVGMVEASEHAAPSSRDELYVETDLEIFSTQVVSGATSDGFI